MATTARHALDERHLGSLVDAMALDEQAWSASGGTHMTCTWPATGTPVVIELGMDMNQLYWTHQMAGRAPDLLPGLRSSGESLGALPVR